MLGGSPQWDAIVAQQLADPAGISEGLFGIPRFPLLTIGTVLGVKEVFRITVIRAIGDAWVACVDAILIYAIGLCLPSDQLGLAFLLVMPLMLVRGYFVDIT